MVRYEVHVLVPAEGQRYVGEWQRVSTHRAEADALREIWYRDQQEEKYEDGTTTRYVVMHIHFAEVWDPARERQWLHQNAFRITQVVSPPPFVCPHALLRSVPSLIPVCLMPAS